MIRRPPRSTLSSSSAASDVYKRQVSTQSTGTRRRRMGKQRYWFFANQAITLVNNPGKRYFESDKIATAVFRVAPSMKKPQIKEYLSSIYGMDVVKVNTANYEGKKYFYPKGNQMGWYKRPDWKKAVVQYKKENTCLLYTSPSPRDS
eukprot:TRINITY_DN11644_c0_g1_i2.p1 TRINITY_DN11644_c0_g1~~TRINITY_DN11644_c0_g1_i2.p1  ORF type:complete len:147 (-),score=37.37 TRINITY_DN11644_c0_g1_i2:49-489(-)